MSADFDERMAVLGPHLFEGVPLAVAARRAEVPRRSATRWLDGDVVGAIVRITGGNFRLIERLMTQIGRLRDINNLDDITVDLVNAARQTLIIGT